MRLSLFLVIFTLILSGCAKPQRYFIGDSQSLSHEQAVTALKKQSISWKGPLELDQPTQIVHAVPSPYPREAIRAGLEGRVIVEMEVDERGNVARTTIIGESPKLLVDAAVSAVSQWKFRPHTYRGAPAKVRLRQPITFQLEPREDPAPTQ
ncbi:energy transducer TonB [Variovorax sp. DT-64]|uniref:energy transducer TonB n=1 Tax=Variovorax sp. DT-64 TaxID=3396160 RepID=UPI003F1E063D